MSHSGWYDLHQWFGESGPAELLLPLGDPHDLDVLGTNCLHWTVLRVALDTLVAYALERKPGVHTCNLSDWKAEAGGLLSSRPSWYP